MSGITRNSAIGASGLVGDWTLYRFTATDASWTIPAWATMLYIEAIGGGGAGGGNGGWYTDTHGGAWNSWAQGTAANGFANGDTVISDGPASAGTSRPYGAGDGGAGMHDDESDALTEIGGAGGVPGGGGGGSNKNSAGTPVGGAGGRGEVRIWAI